MTEEPQEKILPVTGAEARLLYQVLRDEQVQKDALEEYRWQQMGHTGVRGRREVKPLQHDGDDVAFYEADIPARRYHRLRQKYGREIFTTDAGMKDVKKHHPEWFPKQVSGKIMAGFGGKYDGRAPVARSVQTGRRRVVFGRGTLNLATK